MPALKHTLAFNAETNQVVKPAGMKAAFANAVEYDPVRDKGKLVCIHCKQARMTHRDEKAAIGPGNIFGWNSHFATIGSREPKKEKRDKDGTVIPYRPNVHTKECNAAVTTKKEPDGVDLKALEASEKEPAAEVKGYKIYIDMGNISRIFKGGAQYVSRDPQTRRIINHDPDLDGRERLTQKSPHDFTIALKHLDADRLNRSVVVFENHKYPWSELFARMEPRHAAEPDIRWKNIARAILKGRDAPVFAHMNLMGKEATVLRDPRKGKRMRYFLGSVEVEDEADHRQITVKYWLNIRSEHMFDMVRDSAAKEFIGLVRPDGYADNHDAGVFHVDLSVRSTKMLIEADLRAITFEALKGPSRQSLPRHQAWPSFQKTGLSG